MDKFKLIEEIENFNSVGKKRVTFSLVQKLRRKNENYFFHNTSLREDVGVGISSILIEGFCNILKSFELKEYDPYYVPDKTIEYMRLSDVPMYEHFKIESSGENNMNLNPEEIDISKISFYYSRIENNETDDKIIFFKNYRNQKIVRNYMPFQLFDHTLRKIESPVFYVDPLSDLLIFNDYVFIYNRNSLNTVFNYRDEFFKNLDIALDAIEEGDIIENFDEFKKDCKQGVQTARIFTRILREEDRKNNFNLIIENFEDVPAALKTFNLGVEFDGNNRVIYRGREDLKIMSTIFSDGFAKTLIRERHIIAGDDEELTD